MIKNKVKIVERAGWLAETNSSSSHALSICSEPDFYAKPGDPEFDLDIRDGILYVPNRIEDFGWEYEKSNSCQTKLQYVCGLVFHSYQQLYKQKEPKRLELILKNYLGIKKIVFEWEKDYIENYKSKEFDPDYLGSPEIDHQSYSESREEILESNKTIIDFIFNKKSWYFGGNDNSSAPDGYYSELSKSGRQVCEETSTEDNATATLLFGGTLGNVDFRINLYSSDRRISINDPDLIGKINAFDNIRLLDNIVYSPEKGFVITGDDNNILKSRSNSYFRVQFDYLDKNNKCFVVFLNSSGEEEYMTLLKKKMDTSIDMREIAENIGRMNKILVPVKLVSDEFGEIFVP